MFPFRQALYLDGTGVVWNKSVRSATTGFMPDTFTVENPMIRSTGENFNGIFVAGGDYLRRRRHHRLHGQRP